jgi:hypothetical protein
VNRAELLVPDGWRPARGNRVTVLASKDDPRPPAGVWRVVDRAPAGWWLIPHDDTAREWARRWPNQVTQGCVEVSGRRLIPPGHTPRSSAPAAPRGTAGA